MSRIFRNVLLISFILITPFFVYFALSYFGFINKAFPPSLKTVLETDKVEDISVLPVKYKVIQLADNLYVPWGIVFTSDNRALVTERDGKIRVFEDGTLLSSPLYKFDVSHNNEEGLMGIDISPNYNTNKTFYVCYAYNEQGKLYDRVVSLIDKGDSAEISNTLLDKIPSANFHAGCRLKFGPDGFLYVTTGDAGDKNLAQDKDSLAGKILRIDENGRIPQDNPFNNYVYSLGHRNPQGITWDLEGKFMYSTEHGPSLFDGPAGGDEVNLIIRGDNYGWPIVSHENTKEGLHSPLTTFTPAVAPGSALIYSGKMFPQFKDNLFFGALRGEGIYRIVFEENSPEKILGLEKLIDSKYGRIREVVESPTGEIWFTTSNRDGRGRLQENDDKIFMITKE